MRTLTWSWSHYVLPLTLMQFNSVVSAITSCFMAVVNAIVTVSLLLTTRNFMPEC